MSEQLTKPQLAPVVRSSGYSYNVLVVLIVTVAIILGMAKIAIGAIFFNECRLQPLIPVYLIVDSCFGLLVPWTIENKDKRIAVRMQLALGLFHTVGLICGTVWVIDVSQKIYDVTHCTTTTTPTTLLSTALDVNMTSEAIYTVATISTVVTCATCSVVLVKFATAVIVLQWVIAFLAMFNGAIVIIKHYFSSQPENDCFQKKGDENEAKDPLYNPQFSVTM